MDFENNNVEDVSPVGETSAECAGERTVPGAVSAAAEESKKLPDIGLEGHGIKDFWRKTLRERKYLLICFFLPAAIMWLIYITMEVYPFGENSVLVLDLNGQYVYFFQALRDIITEGGSLLYSFRRSLGGEFLGIIGYYIASPFSAIVALFPETHITEALLVIFLLKTGLCGLTFGSYIEATRKRNRPMTVVFSTLYALCAYAVVMQHNTMWIDNLIYLPLILLGVENIIKNGKYKMFVITLSLAIMSNFYIGYMTCIFVALYFFYYYYSLSPEERNPLGVKFHLAKTIGKMAVFSAVAIIISAVYIWSSYQALTFGKSDFTHPSYALSQKFDFLDLVSKMYFGSYDTVRPEGWPFVYCGMLTFILLPLYFFVKKISLREKIATAILVLFMVFSFNASTLDLVWHGMQRPNWLNYRYSFMLCFLFIIMAYKAYENIRDIGYRPIIISAGVITLVLFVLQKLEYENIPDLTSVWPSIGFIVAYLLLLRGATWSVKNIRNTTALVLVMIVSFEAYTAGLANLVDLDDDVVYSKRTGFRDFIDKYSPVVDKLKEDDPGFYRMEKTSHRKTNDNMALGIYGVSNSTSTLNASTIKLLGDYGISSKSHWSKYLGATPVFDSIFGIKYIMTENVSLMSSLYEKKSQVGSVFIYENPYAMSIAAGVNEALASFDETQYKSPFERMNDTVAAMLGEENGVKIFKPLKQSSIINTMNCTQNYTSGHIKYTKSSDSDISSVTLSFEAENSKNVLMYIPSDYTRECKLYVNGAAKDTYFANETCRIVDIGIFEPGENVEIRLELQKDNLYLKDNCDYFYYFDENVFTEAMPKLKTSEFNVNYHTEDTLCGTIHVLPGQELIYTSIPYDEGWKVSANGNAVETFEVMNGLTAFRLSAGSYNLEMKYRPDCAVYGIMISCAGVVIFALMWIGEYLLRKRRVRVGAALTESRTDGEISDTALSEDITETSENISDAKPLTDGDASGANETAEDSDTECDSEREAHDGSSEGESE